MENKKKQKIEEVKCKKCGRKFIGLSIKQAENFLHIHQISHLREEKILTQKA